MGHAVQATLAVAGDVSHESVVGPCVGPLRRAVLSQHPLPQQSVVGEEDGGVDAELVQGSQTGAGRTVGGRYELLEGVFRPLTTGPADVIATDGRGILRKGHLDVGQLAPPPDQIGPPGRIVLDTQGVITMGRIDVVDPGPAGLEQMLIDVDGAHGIRPPRAEYQRPPYALGVSGRGEDSLWAPDRRALTTGLVLTITFIASEALAVVTVMPLVARDLKGISLYGWVFSAFMLGALVGIVVAGGVGREPPRILRAHDRGQCRDHPVGRGAACLVPHAPEADRRVVEVLADQLAQLLLRVLEELGGGQRLVDERYLRPRHDARAYQVSDCW